MRKLLLLLSCIFFAAAFSVKAQLLDNFEDNNSTNEWSGIWEAFNDANATSNMAMEIANIGYNGSNYSIHITGQFASYGGVVTYLNADKTAMNLTGKNTGISFSAKGTGVPVRIRVRELKAESARGYAYMGKVFTPTTDWAFYTIPFDSLTPQYGDPVPPFDATDLYAVDFGPAAGSSAIDVYVDDLILTEPTPVPVELSSFSASINNGVVNLVWKSATETNNSGFEIERKAEGSWIKIGFVKGHGTTTNPNQYSFIDNLKNVEGNFSYRLKQVDFNGTFSYSNIVMIQNIAPAAFALNQNYPNPFNPTTVIKYSIAEESFVTLKVYNTLGKEVASLVNENMSGGSHNVEFNAANLASGIYMYTIQAGNNLLTKKMLLMK